MTTLMLALALALGGCAEREKGNEAEDAGTKAADPVPRVAIVEPAEGAEVMGPTVRIVLGVEYLQLAPAGDSTPGTGHHHLFVNASLTAPGEPIPVGTPGIIHLGQAQTSYELTNLSAGEYTVISVIGDLAHRRIDPQAADTVRFRVR